MRLIFFFMLRAIALLMRFATLMPLPPLRHYAAGFRLPATPRRFDGCC